MLTYDLEKSSKPLYEVLYIGIRDDILSGALKGGFKLPSKRALATHLNISVITVQNAYSELLAQGFIYSKIRSGYFVSSGIKPIKKEPNLTPKIKKPTKKLINLSSSNISNFPLSTWNKIFRQVISKEDITKSVPFNGTLALRKAIKKHLFEYQNLKEDEDSIIIGAGAQYLYTLITQLLSKDKIYALEKISDTKIAKIYKSLGVSCVFLNSDKGGISVSELYKSGASVVHISPSMSFPAGINMPIKRRSEILEWVNFSSNLGKNSKISSQNSKISDEKFIIEDEYISDFRDIITPPLRSMSRENVIFLNTFSKTLLPTLRVSYMVLPPNLMAKFRKKLSFYSSTVPIFEQLTLAKFIEDGYFERFLNRRKKELSLKKAEILKTLTPLKIPYKLTLSHLLLELNFDENLLKKRCKKAGYLINTISDFTNHSIHSKPKFSKKESLKTTTAIIDLNSNLKDFENFINLISEIQL